MRRRTLLGGLASGIVTSGIAAGNEVVAREDGGREPSLERCDQRCAGDERETATVRCLEDRVVVEGLIRTPTPCHEIVLESVSRVPECDVLEVAIRVGSQEGFCVQCLGVVEYRLALPLEDPRVDRVAVVHVRSDETVRVPGSSGER